MTDALRALLAADAERMRILQLVGGLALPDCWIGAGFVRNAVWDHLHGRACSLPNGDVDVIWFDRSERAAEDATLEARLAALDPGVRWSVKNQARMHRRNGDLPYGSAVDALRFWPETATAVAVRWDGHIEIAAPFGLDDLFGRIIRPTPGFRGVKHGAYLERVRAKNWLEVWPMLRMA